MLVRAGEAVAGRELKHVWRPHASALDLCRGPGKLATALGIARIHDGLDLVVPGPLWLAAGVPPREIRTSVRIGITKAADSLLRFYEADSPFVSGPRKLNS
ncbi:MAG: hypothetical protein NVSMB59_21740 [Vulcanimicrobiaceae bacterium]